MRLILCLLSVFLLSVSIVKNAGAGAGGGASEFGTAEEAQQILTRTVNLVKANETVAFAMVTAGMGGLMIKDLYPFCIDSTGIMVAHPYSTGQDMTEFKSTDGVKVASVMLKNAKGGKISKVTYAIGRPTGTALSSDAFKKITLYTKAGNFVCASGFYSK
ncbi:MAG: chemotaxis protein [Burkholderiaceae bacterium]|nr:MAG: chemotaxis protein [Burkholderiaceae bacterium]